MQNSSWCPEGAVTAGTKIIYEPSYPHNLPRYTTILGFRSKSVYFSR